MSSSLDYLDLCRLCLVKDRVSVPIFEDEGDVRQMFLKITACLPVKIAREDKLPKKICDDCVYKVELLYQFWNTTANAEKQLLQWLGEVGGLEDKQGYVTEVLDSSAMKQEQPSDNRLDGSIMQVRGHQNNMEMGMMNNMTLITMPTGSEQFTSVPMDTTGTVQTIPSGSSTQVTHDQIVQNQTAVGHMAEEESEEEDNSDEGCDNEEGLPVKEEAEEDPNDQSLEQTAFVNVPISCGEAGPSGLQQQKISEMSEMAMQPSNDVDPKSGAQTICLQGPNNQLIFIRVKNEVETQQRQQQTIILPEHQQSIILPQQQESFTLSQPQQQLLFLQQPQSEQPLLLLQQQNQQQSLILLQQPEQEEDQVYKPVIVLQQSQQHQQQDLIVKTEEINQNVKNELQPSELVDSDRPISILPVIKSVQQKTVRNIRNSKPNVRIISNTLKISKSDVVEVNGLEKNQDDALIKSQFSSIQERTLGAAESTFSSQDFPSTSEENAKNFQETDNLSEGYFNDLVKEDSKYNFDVDDMQDIYGRKDDGSYCCNICQITRVDRRSILSHISGQHSHLRPHKCIICDKTFKRKYSLKVHELSHNVKSSIKAFSCDKCDYCTPNKVSLRYHKYRVHTNEYRFTCEHCGKRYKMKRELADHLVTHSGVQHICDICGKLYRGEHLLRAHRRLHLDLYKFQCAVCKKKLSTERSLSNHLKLHNRTYECDECSMKFPSKYNLIKHRNVHTREQAYTCPECGKIFADRATQKVHSLMHAGIKPYRCNVCGAGFTQRSPMMLHWRKKHPGETDPPPPVILKNILKSIKEQNGTKVLPIDE